MRTPDEKFVAYNDEQWQKIKDSLAVVGVDADVVTLTRNIWLRYIVLARGDRLRTALDELGRCYANLPKQLTLRQRAREQRKTLELVEAALDSCRKTFFLVKGLRTGGGAGSARHRA